jgi:hypothetical protein
LDQEEEKKDNILELEEDDSSDAASDEEVRHEEHVSEDGSSAHLGEEDHCENYSGWRYSRTSTQKTLDLTTAERDMCRVDILDDEDSPKNTFRIAVGLWDDKSAQPHVLSPPLMDALMSFLPDNLTGRISG